MCARSEEDLLNSPWAICTAGARSCTGNVTVMNSGDGATCSSTARSATVRTCHSSRDVVFFWKKANGPGQT